LRSSPSWEIERLGGGKSASCKKSYQYLKVNNNTFDFVWFEEQHKKILLFPDHFSTQHIDFSFIFGNYPYNTILE